MQRIAFMPTVGEIFAILKEKECDVEWKIDDILELPKLSHGFYISSLFAFNGEFWKLGMEPYGKTETEGSTGHIDLALCRESCGSFINVEVSLAFKTLNGQKDMERHYIQAFQTNSWHDFSRFMSRSHLCSRQSEFLVSGSLTVTCKLKIINPTGSASDSTTARWSYSNSSLDDSAFSSVKRKCMNKPIECPECSVLIDRQSWYESENASENGNEKLSNDLKEMMLSGNHSDVTINVRGEEFRLHRNILSARSSFFNSMFKSNMKEMITGIISIDDCEPDKFRSFIHFLYTEKVDKLSPEKIFDLYKVADKYQEDQLKKECLQFMMKNFCDCTFFAVTVFALKHEEKELFQKAKEYFCQRVKKIIGCTEWETFLIDYPKQANELYNEAADYFVKE